MHSVQDFKTMADFPFHIIYVDDNPNDAYIFESCVNKLNHPPKFTWLEDGFMLLSYLKKTGLFKTLPETPEYRVIILDVNMPELSGFEIIEKIRSETSEEINKIPIVLLSSSNREEDILRSQEVGAHGYLIKAASFKDAMATIKEIMKTWSQPSKIPLTTV